FRLSLEVGGIALPSKRKEHRPLESAQTIDVEVALQEHLDESLQSRWTFCHPWWLFSGRRWWWDDSARQLQSHERGHHLSRRQHRDLAELLPQRGFISAEPRSSRPRRLVQSQAEQPLGM